MPTATHEDNGLLRLLYSDDCPCCSSFNTFKIEENDLYHFEHCINCGYETQEDLNEPKS
jgi:Zn ribbon nucleic-acid-binding protein